MARTPRSLVVVGPEKMNTDIDPRPCIANRIRHARSRWFPQNEWFAYENNEVRVPPAQGRGRMASAEL
jgi:hypothetical protein